jgi:hypothetical protein
VITVAASIKSNPNLTFQMMCSSVTVSCNLIIL